MPHSSAWRARIRFDRITISLVRVMPIIFAAALIRRI